MDRNTGNDTAHRPLGSSPVARMHSTDHESCYESSRQTLARMPNLTTTEADLDSLSRSNRGDRQAVSSGLSLKVLAGVGVGFCVIAVLGFLLVDRNKQADTLDSATWQAPSPDMETTPPWGATPLATTSQTLPEAGATPWNSPSPTPAWNAETTNAPTGAPWGVPPGQTSAWQGDQHQPSSQNPTELTATSTPPSEPVWGQVSPAASASSTPSTSWSNPPQTAAWNSAAPMQPPADTVNGQSPTGFNGPQAPSNYGPQQSFVMPANMPTPVATVDPNSQAVNPSNTTSQYPTDYGRPADQAVQRDVSSNATPQYPTGYGAAPATPAYTNSNSAQAGVNQPMAVGSPVVEPRFDPRGGYGTDGRNAGQPLYPQAASTPPPGEYRAADSRYGYGLDQRANTQPNYAGDGNRPGYPAPSYSGANQPIGQGYPSPNGSSGYPTAGYPSAGQPAAGYPTNQAAYGYPGASYTPPGGMNYPATAPSGAGVPSYDAGSMPQAGSAQFQGVIEKPNNARASYDSTRPGLY